ncbi:metallophosphoesterase [Acidianus sp. HS-5]|uniref:metallophosphoesterase n=1 Tax=Acidianus sp. HS-5 TaxID=2886040 RepID=UPI001F48392A|nr:metallophosphoesterase [Acidianus sp. HS-5]BDC19921.1 phosphoesterase [Acidianus sp. HS-5]
MIEIEKGVYIEGDIPAVYIKSIDTAVISDVHIGYEEEMARKGIFLPRVQKKKFLDVVNKVVKEFNTYNIIVDGDFKHIFNGLGRQEKEDLISALSQIKDLGIKLTLIRGNHDNYISLVTDKFDIEIRDELQVDNMIIFHGHKDVEPRENTIYIIGHEHPRISLRDKLGFSRKLQAFLIVPLKNGSKVLILPSIGSYQAGNDISLIHNNYMSPIVRNYGILEEAKPYVIIEGEGIMEFPKLELLKNIVV